MGEEAGDELWMWRLIKLITSKRLAMKLQKLTSSKFAPFYKNAVHDLAVVTGGVATVMSSSHGASGNRYDCSSPTGSPGTSSGDWGNASWHSGSASMGASGPGICARIAFTSNTFTSILDPTNLNNVISIHSGLDSATNKIRF